MHAMSGKGSAQRDCMEQPIKKTRKSVPRPNSGRRAVDGATDLVKVGIRLTPAQHEWVKANGQHALRQLIQAHIDAGKAESTIIETASAAEVQRKAYGLVYGALTANQKAYWRKQCERYGIPIHEGLND